MNISKQAGFSIVKVIMTNVDPANANAHVECQDCFHEASFDLYNNASLYVKFAGSPQLIDQGSYLKLIPNLTNLKVDWLLLLRQNS